MTTFILSQITNGVRVLVGPHRHSSFVGGRWAAHNLGIKGPTAKEGKQRPLARAPGQAGRPPQLGAFTATGWSQDPVAPSGPKQNY